MATKSFGSTRVAPNIDRHGWIATEKVKTRFGTFEFKNGYPSAVAADALLEQLKFNRALEVFLTQMPAVSSLPSTAGSRSSASSAATRSSSGSR